MIAVVFALALVPTLGIVGSALDYNRAVQSRTQLQSAADAAALAGLNARTSSASERQVVAERVFQANRPAGVNAAAVVQVSPKDVVVTATGRVETSILKVLRVSAIEVGAKARAAQANHGLPPCVLALNKTATPAISISGKADYEAKGCVVQSNSSANSAIDIGGTSTVKADGYCAVGTITSKVTLTPAPKNYCEPMDDPFAKLGPPLDTSCHRTNLSVGPSETRTLDAGVYCGGLSLQGDVTLSPGLYVIKDGPLSMNSQGTIIGKGVTFYLMGKDAGVDINGGAKLELTPMTSGPYSGLLFVQDRNSNLGAISKLNGNAASLFQGVVYMPTQQIQINGTASTKQENTFFPIIADTIKISGTASAAATADATGLNLVTALPQSASGARLAE
jgi:hypothetical protein